MVFGIWNSFFYIFRKVLNYSMLIKQIIISVLWCLILAFIYVSAPAWIEMLIILPVYCIASIVLIWTLTRIKLDTTISAFLLSFGIGYILYYIALILVALIFMPFVSNNYIKSSVINYNKPIYFLIYTLTSATQLLLSYFFFRIRRFKDGFPFLFKRYAIIIALISAGTILIFATWIKLFTVSENAYDVYLYLIGILTIGIGIYIWIRRGIKMFYKRKMKEQNIEILEQELEEKNQEIKRLTEQNDALRIANHKANHRLAALEDNVAGLVSIVKNLNYHNEVGEELAITLDDIKRLSRDYQNDVNKVKNAKILPLTKIKMIDDIFRYFSKQCDDNNINFILKINGSIPYMAEHIIPQSKLETMIGDHIQDAIIAVNSSTNPFRSILVILGLIGDTYELAIHDSGISFEVDTLIRLGNEHITTHANSGGTGIGFVTTFETMRECGASLIINEKESSNTDYSKIITIRFDGKNQYIIETYRPDAFPSPGDRYIMKSNASLQIEHKTTDLSGY